MQRNPAALLARGEHDVDPVGDGATVHAAWRQESFVGEMSKTAARCRSREVSDRLASTTC